MRLYLVSLAGEASYQTAIARTRAGAPVIFRHEPHNAHDARAIAVRVPGKTEAGEIVGYLPRDSWLTRVILDEEGHWVRGFVQEITGAATEKPYRGVVLRIALFDEYDQDEGAVDRFQRKVWRDYDKGLVPPAVPTKRR